MRELTRRAALQSGLGAGLAVALSSCVSDKPPRRAVSNRVRVTTGSVYGARRTSVPVDFPAAAVGNLLLAVISVDGSAGKFKAPAGWDIVFQRIGTSMSLAALNRWGTGDDSPATFPWTTSSPGGSWLVAEYTGINDDDPLGPLASPGYSDSARTSLVLNPRTPDSPGIQVAVFGIGAMDPMPSDRREAGFRPAAVGWDWVATSYDTGQSACPGTALTEYSEPLPTGRKLPLTRFSWERSDHVIGAVLLLNTGPRAPALLSRWVGAVSPTGATIAVKLANTSRARVRVFADPDLAADVVDGPSASPDDNGMAKLVVDGLQAGTQYHYAVELDGVLDRSAAGSFRTAPSRAASFVFAFASCCKTPDADTFSEIRGHDPDFFLHLGDLHYGDIGVNDPTAYRAKYDAALASAHQGPFYANVPTVYTWSDHDFGPNGSDSTSPSKPAAQDTYRQYVPSYPLPSPTGGIYQTFTYGRVRFIATDNRSYTSPRSAVDDEHKSMLGAEQKKWFKDTIAAATEPVIIWMNENPWISPPSKLGDWWGGYTTEREELAGFIAASDKKLAIVSGDMHALAADDGSDSPGGIPVFQAAPLFGSSSHKGGPYTFGPVPSSEDVPAQQYGVMSVVDSGAEIALQFTGYRAGGIAEVEYTYTFSV